jgi:hypothetical protein
MFSRNSTLALTLILALTATSAVRAGETTAERASSTDVPTVTVSASPGAQYCDGLTPDEARRHAEQAKRDGAHRKAADCFRIAGDHVRADRAQLRASADAGDVSAQKTAANIETAKAQARRIRDALR